MDNVNERLSDLQIQVKNKSEELRLLQSQKVALMRTKDKMHKELESRDCTLKHRSAVRVDDQKMYERVLPLVSEIHQLEMRKQEIHHQLHLLEVHKDIQNIFTTLTTVAHTDERSSLSPWFQELKSLYSASDKTTPVCVLQQPRYDSHVQSNQLIERLEFTLGYCGFSVHLTVSKHTCLNDSDRTKTEVSDDILAKSDIHLTGLEDKTKHLLKHSSSVMDLLHFIKESLDNDIVPCK